MTRLLGLTIVLILMALMVLPAPATEHQTGIFNSDLAVKPSAELKEAILGARYSTGPAVVTSISNRVDEGGYHYYNIELEPVSTSAPFPDFDSLLTLHIPSDPAITSDYLLFQSMFDILLHALSSRVPVDVVYRKYNDTTLPPEVESISLSYELGK